MTNKIKPIPKNKKCQYCGNKITHHHYLCDTCWNQQKKEGRIRRKAKKQASQWAKKKSEENKEINFLRFCQICGRMTRHSNYKCTACGM